MNQKYSFLVKNYLFAFFILGLSSCSLFTKTNKSNINANNTAQSKSEIASILDKFNLAAATADYEGYFKFFAEDAVFIGTDATENWDKQHFMKWSKPYFDRKKAWNFTAIQRNIYLSKDGSYAWFDELLNTQMKICRGSGVMIRHNNTWLIQQYVLSMTIPNTVSQPVIQIKQYEEDSLIQVLKKN